MFESHRVEQFCCALSSARIAQRGFAVVGSTRACPGPASWSPKVESSCNADNLDFVSIFDGELEDLVPGRRDVSSDIEKLHLSKLCSKLAARSASLWSVARRGYESVFREPSPLTHWL